MPSPAAGCQRVFEDRASGARTDRPGLAAALSHLRRGDTLVIWRLDRLGRTTHQLVGLLERFEHEGIRLRSLQDGIDPASVMGRATLQIGAVFAEMERNLLRERTRAALDLPAADVVPADREGALDWASITVGLDTQGWAVLPWLLTPQECEEMAGLVR